MSGLFNKAKSMLSGKNADKIADAVETNVTDERVDSVLGKVPGGEKLADKVPDNVGEKAGDAIREHLGSDQPNS